MNYELAKQLKDAGFPQIYRVYKDEVITEFGPMDEHSANELGYEYALVPTLSELIEACGINLQNCLISKRQDGRFYVVFKYSDDGNGNELDYCLHDLSEVFAYYWLELNNKI